jgi:hypothetical protein
MIHCATLDEALCDLRELVTSEMEAAATPHHREGGPSFDRYGIAIDNGSRFPPKRWVSLRSTGDTCSTNHSRLRRPANISPRSSDASAPGPGITSAMARIFMPSPISPISVAAPVSRFIE